MNVMSGITSTGRPSVSMPLLSVVVPAYRCASYLDAVLAALEASTLAREHWELIVVDDGSDDATAQVAARRADLLLHTGGPFGPAAARNLGVGAARGDVLVFVDSDVVVAPDALARIAAHWQADPTLGALFGSYDDSPRHPTLVSQYRNLLHHYTHHQEAGNAYTFWAGCGAVQAAAFRAVGGFDAVRYPRPQIEDIELGYRLRSRGHRLLLDPAIQGTHLKAWTFSGMVRTDLRDRAIPWMTLLIERCEVFADGPLNLGLRQKALTLAASAVLVAPVVAIFFERLWPLWVGAFALLLVIAANASLLAWFERKRGFRFAVGAVPLRLIFYLVSAVGATIALVNARFRRRRPVVSLKPLHANRNAA